MTKYRLEGLDCAVCAQDLEEGLRKLGGVRSVAVDFATLTLHVDAPDLPAVEKEARRLSPGLGLSSPGRALEAAGAAPPSRALVSAAAAVLVALAGLAIEALVPVPPWFAVLAWILAWLIAGGEVLLGALRNLARGRVFDELFLMSIATLGALVIGQYEEAIGVMVLYRIGETLQDLAVVRSRKSVRALLELQPTVARTRRGGGWALVPAELLTKGDLVQVLPGEALPADGIVEAGEAYVDTRALTGESAPRSAAPGIEVLGATLVIDGALEVRISSPPSESRAARMLALVEGAAARKAPTERLVTRLARWYTPAVVGLAAAVAFLPPLLVPGQELATWSYRALVMLVISCPCALVISIPLGYFAGIGGAARAGILVKGGASLDKLARARRVVFDKTGTLTDGSFRVLDVEAEAPHTADGLVALAAAAESLSRHPLSLALREEAARRGLAPAEEASIADFREQPGRGVSVRIGGRPVLAGNRSLLGGLAPASPGSTGAGADSPREGFAAAASTEVLVAVDGRYAGRILVGDRPKEGAAAALAELGRLGLGPSVILTGDAEGPARATARALGVGELRHSLLPEDKVGALEAIMAEEEARGGRAGGIIFVGDGTNDAPVMARADVGVAMGGGTEAAMETADIVLVSGDPWRVPEAIVHARRTRRIILQNIVFAIAVKASFLVLGAAGEADMWLAVIADVGVAILAVLNASRALLVRVRPSPSSLP